MYNITALARARRYAVEFLGAHFHQSPTLCHRLKGSNEDTEHNGTETSNVGSSTTSALGRAGGGSGSAHAP
jgi:hypothetical protein